MRKAKREPLPPLLISLDETAARLDLSRTTIKKLISTGKLRSVKIGPLRRVLVASVDQYVNALEKGELT